MNYGFGFRRSSPMRRTPAAAAAARVERLEDRRLFSASVGQLSTFDGVELGATTGTAGDALRTPGVRSTRPHGGTTHVDPGADIVAYVNLPNLAGVSPDPAILASGVHLHREGDETPVPISVNTTG